MAQLKTRIGIAAAIAINGDQVPDVAIGAPGSERVLIYSGGNGALLRTMTATSGAPTFGIDVEAIDDVDGDGGIDFLVGASSAGMMTDPAGKVFIMKGIPIENNCPADVNDSGAVDVSDLLSLLAAWGRCPGCPEDLNGDGRVLVSDLLALLAAWGPCGP